MSTNYRELINQEITDNGLAQSDDLLRIITTLIKFEVPFSDILVHEDSPIMIRMAREWVEVPLGEIYRSKIEEFLYGIDNKWTDKLIPDVENQPEVAANATLKMNFSRDMDDMVIRCNCFVHGATAKLGMAIRRIPKNIPTLAEVGLPVSISHALNRNSGLILITGPVGNAKSTTMAAMLNYLNNIRVSHILTLEDPIEFIHKNTKSIFTQREIPTHAKTYKSGFEEALRERPDVVAIGELRNRDTIETCLEGADAGLLMIATMHSNNASSAIGKFLSFYSGEEAKQKAAQLSESLIAVVSQRLVPSLARDDGSSELAYEILVNNSQVQQKIAANDPQGIRSAMKLDNSSTLQLRSNTLNECLAKMVKDKKVSQVDAMNYTFDSMDLEKEIKKP